MRLFALLAVLVGALLLSTPAAAWSHGDVVPLLIELKVNKTHVTQRSIPYHLNPRFGIDHVVSLPSLSYDSEFETVKMRIELGRGLKRRTAWIVIKDKNKYLERLQLKFKFRQNVFGKFEKLSYVDTYSTTPKPTVVFEYVWVEERLYNPHGAITFFSAVSLLLVVVLMVRMTTTALARQGRMSFVVHEKET